MLEVKGLRTEFIRWLEANDPPAHPGEMARNVLFSYYHDIGLPFDDIFRDEASMAQARELLAVHFGKVGRKDPEEQAALHHEGWRRFREFLEATDRLSLLGTPESGEGESVFNDGTSENSRTQ